MISSPPRKVPQISWGSTCPRLQEVPVVSVGQIPLLGKDMAIMIDQADVVLDLASEQSITCISQILFLDSNILDTEP